MRFLLDTNVISEVRKAKPDVNVRAWFETVDDEDLYLSVLTIGEIRQGIERLRSRDPVHARTLETWLTLVRSEYADRLLPITTEIAEEWGRMNVLDPVPAVDGLLAATARTCGLTLVTRNVSDVAPTGVSVLDPFSPAV